MTGLIILAAGGSSRLGIPKQTLPYKGKTLLELAIRAGRRSKCNPVNVVLGANWEVVESVIKQLDICIIHNTYWAEGMASSIRMAVKAIGKTGVDSVVIMLCDQPFVTYTLINSLLCRQRQTNKKIVACAYNGITGVPALFDRSLFKELCLLRGQEGAKKILFDHPGDVATVPFQRGGIDIDTMADYEELIKNA